MPTNSVVPIANVHNPNAKTTAGSRLTFTPQKAELARASRRPTRERDR